jgi:transposase
METIAMGRKEVRRPGLVAAALEGKITNKEGAEALGLSVRQFRRLKERYRKGGVGALVHGLRGRPSNRRLAGELRERVVALVKGTYAGLNDTHLTEKLREKERIAIGRPTVRRLRVSLGISAKRVRRSPQHRKRRLREGREGALVQVDGSPFAWLEERGPEMTLVGAVDDATGRILGAVFRPTEDLHGYATVFRQVFTRYGLPLAFYGDGTSILVRNDQRWTLEEELRGEQNRTHLGCVLEDLAIRYVRAHSPQAKGRIENRWATFQDRLTAELRLHGISALEPANAFLPVFLDDFNHRFARTSREIGLAWRQPPRNLDLVLSCRYDRVVANDNTVSLPGHRKPERHRSDLGRPAAPARIIQIPPGPRRRSYARCRVEVRELLDGRLLVFYHGQIIASQPTPPQFVLSPRGRSRLGITTVSPAKPIQTRIVTQQRARSASQPPASRKPSPTHPWNRSFSRRAPRFTTPRGEDISIEQ